ncbi:UNVERIFIED_CONTAM: hypothetical protein K2H54_063093 [Gekko kuhli]
MVLYPDQGGGGEEDAAREAEDDEGTWQVDDAFRQEQNDDPSLEATRRMLAVDEGTPVDTRRAERLPRIEISKRILRS